MSGLVLNFPMDLMVVK